MNPYKAITSLAKSKIKNLIDRLIVFQFTYAITFFFSIFHLEKSGHIRHGRDTISFSVHRRAVFNISMAHRRWRLKRNKLPHIGEPKFW